ncbi:unnamed protein product [Protopolystoma xenopodis]|uniref:Uncharacterized protein n=1 Tax=Protopolystoma xenopodis TaxID=117903 RepID=A0A448XAJ6_9PLAT|nr:unnamed protein product [Protopolystoma xenopodis]
MLKHDLREASKAAFSTNLSSGLIHLRRDRRCAPKQPHMSPPPHVCCGCCTVTRHRDTDYEWLPKKGRLVPVDDEKRPMWRDVLAPSQPPTKSRLPIKPSRHVETGQ